MDEHSDEETLEEVLQRLRNVKDDGIVVDPNPVRKVVEALQIHGELLGKLIRSNDKLLASSSTTETLTKSLLYITFALVALMLIQVAAVSVSSQLSFWLVIAVIITIVFLAGFITYSLNRAVGLLRKTSREAFGEDS